MGKLELSALEHHTLTLLGEGEMYGLALVKASEAMGQTVRLRRGAVYVLLGRMGERLLVESRQEAETPPEINIPRRIYRATSIGKRAVA